MDIASTRSGKSTPTSRRRSGLLLGACAVAVAARMDATVAQVSTSGVVTPIGTMSPTWNVGASLVVGNAGSGMLSVDAGGTVTATQCFIGQSTNGIGTVTVAGADALLQTSGNLYIGRTGADNTLNITSGGTVINGTALVGDLTGARGTVNVSGAGSLWQSTSNFWLANSTSSSATLTISDGATVMSGSSVAGRTASSIGMATVSGAGSVWQLTTLMLGQEGTGVATIEEGGRIVATGSISRLGQLPGASGTMTVTGAGSLWEGLTLYVGDRGAGELTIADGGRALVSSATIAASGAASGTLHLDGTPGARGVLETGWIISGSGTGGSTLILDGGILRATGNQTNFLRNFTSGQLLMGAGGAFIDSNGFDITIGTVLEGSGAVEKIGAGGLLLTGDSSGFTGTTTVADGTLLVGAGGVGRLGGTVQVSAGGTLGGSGALTGDVFVAGTLSAGNSPGTLSFAELTLTAGSTSLFELNTPGVIGGSNPSTGNDLVNVSGMLTLDGTLEARVASAGYYRLFNYGSLAGAFAAEDVTSTTAFSVGRHEVQYGIPGQVNLSVLGAGQTMQFWDGADSLGNGAVDGGTGSWGDAGSNWTGQPGQAAINGGWGRSVGVFTGTAGTVVVDGVQSFDTLQFATNGYALSGGTLAFGPHSGSAATISVDSGLAATVGTTLADGTATGLLKSGGGTLILSGSNTYTGGTTLSGGTLSITDDASLGALSGSLTFAGGTLATTADVSATRPVVLAADGRFDVAGSTTLTLSGALSGPGDLLKSGSGSLILSGFNSHGETHVQSGALAGNTDAFSSAIRNAGTVIFDQASDGAFAADIAGLDGTNGAMTKRGAGALTLTGHSSLDWLLEDGKLVAATDRFSGNAALLSGAEFVLDQSEDGAFAGVLSGNGRFTKSGSGSVLLTTDSSTFSGTTTVSSGGLTVDSTLGGTVEVSSGAFLRGTGTVGAVTVRSGARLVGGGDQTFNISSLMLSAGSRVDVALGSGTSPFNVAHSLTLDGLLHVSDAGGFGAGVYRLFDYGGALTDRGMSIGSTPAGISANALFIQAGIVGQVNLISSAGLTLGFWDGAAPSLHDNGALDGGDGTWTTNDRNWSRSDGSLNGTYGPNPTFAVFQGTPGVVTVAESGIGIAGMQFAADGFTVTGQPLTLAGAGGETVIRVGDGSTAGAGIVAVVDAELTGASGLVKSDLGTLVLRGSNSYAGDTHVRSGTLIGDARAFGGAIRNAGSVIFDQSSDAAFAADIGGLSGIDGTMTKRGAGALTLSGRSSLDWTIEGGQLISAADRFTGNAALLPAGGLILEQSADGSFAGMLSGSGDLTTRGPGTVLLAGDSSAFSGTTTVTDGSLLVNESLGGSLRVLAGARVGGSGSLGSAGAVSLFDAGSIHAPGDGASSGAQRVSGDYINHGTLLISGGPSGTSRVAVAGTADISGATLHLQLAPESSSEWSPVSGPFMILDKQSAGPVTGLFGSVVDNLLFLDASVDYAAGDGNDVMVGFLRNDIAFGEMGTTRNQRVMGRAVEQLASTNPLWNAIALSTNEAVVRAAFDQLSAEVHVAARATMLEETRFIREAFNDRIRAGFGGVASESAPVLAYGANGPEVVAPSTARFAAWGRVFGSWGTIDAGSNAAGVDRDIGGVILGADGFVGDWRVGALAGYTRANFDVDERFSSGSGDTHHLGVYAGTEWDKLALRGGLSYGWHDVDATRSVSFPGFSDRLATDYRARTFQGVGELGYGITAGRARVEPFAAIAYVSVRPDDFVEQGDTAALSISAAAADVTYATLGLRGETNASRGSSDVTFRGMLGWRGAFGDTDLPSAQAFAGSSPFSITGVSIPRNAAVIEGGMDLRVTPGATIGWSYHGQLASGAREHGVRADISVRF